MYSSAPPAATSWLLFKPFLTLDNTYHLAVEQSGKSFAGGDFSYEDYSLTALRLEARVDKATGSPGDPVSLYVRASDENDLPVPDGRVRIWVGQATPTDVFHRPLVFIPDTLWTHSQPLDPVGEIHREYFKNKLSIFCGYLRKGRYEFKVSLLPRFTGVYQLNPARAEMMYFPTLNGRDEMRLIRIE